MRHLLIATVVLGALGCETYPLDPDEWAACEEDGPAFNTRTDPNHCGGCYVRCEADVPCDDWLCQYNTPLHCGAPHRQCVAPTGKGVECVEHYIGPDATEAVNGFSCVIVDLPWSVPDDAPVPIDPRPPVTVGTPGWVGIPGTSDQCMDDVDGRLCQQASVEFVDLCGSDVVQPLAYDFQIMTTEVSRAQYRVAMCGDCIEPTTGLCQDACDDLDAADQLDREARPMTGLNWCAAYDTCQALGGRLPTIQERARVEALAYGSRALFRQETNCTAWVRETGSAPWVARCFDEPPEDLAFDRVDGESGRVLLGVDVLVEPQPVHHLVGNVEEWLADPAEALTTEAVTDGPRWWGPSSTDEGVTRPRVARGQSLFSPSGQPGSRLLVLDPSVRAHDLGVRCARTSRSPFAEPVPYDAELPALEHADCRDEPVGLRPVRQMNGEVVYRAADVCLPGSGPDDLRRSLESRIRQWLVGDEQALARRTLVDGQLVGLGLARFAVDEQWWRVEPAFAPGQAVTVFDDAEELPLVWGGESAQVDASCRSSMPGGGMGATDGRLMRRQDFVLDQDDVRMLFPVVEDARALACGHLTCAETSVAQEDCPSTCESWLLSVAVLFERVEPFDRAPMCAPSVWNPAER